MNTAAEIAEHNENVLRNIERNQLVEKFAESIGCSAEQASTIAKAFSERFEFDGAVLSFKGQPITQARDAVIAHFPRTSSTFCCRKPARLRRPISILICWPQPAPEI